MLVLCYVQWPLLIELKAANLIASNLVFNLHTLIVVAPLQYV